MKGKNTTLLWALLFVGVFLLTQINFLVDFSATPWLLGFPKWLWYMIGIHLLFVFLLYRFTQTFKDDQEG